MKNARHGAWRALSLLADALFPDIRRPCQTAPDTWGRGTALTLILPTSGERHAWQEYPCRADP
ncbi:hypothetical protein CBM2592_B130040 [Cupriavidus taiwanensis]|nr:hypothetical protein CBM2592_B130040 [Cupriavidus taiwanensis]SOZ86154.1 hypothetical protein CBM2618_B170041 [Cupriavidus taiwanensis]